jgi:hypothetical protein
LSNRCVPHLPCTRAWLPLRLPRLLRVTTDWRRARYVHGQAASGQRYHPTSLPFSDTTGTARSTVTSVCAALWLAARVVPCCHTPVKLPRRRLRPCVRPPPPPPRVSSISAALPVKTTLTIRPSLCAGPGNSPHLGEVLEAEHTAPESPERCLPVAAPLSDHTLSVSCSQPFFLCLRCNGTSLTPSSSCGPTGEASPTSTPSAVARTLPLHR